jgi:hypothetical protein
VPGRGATDAAAEDAPKPKRRTQSRAAVTDAAPEEAPKSKRGRAPARKASAEKGDEAAAAPDPSSVDKGVESAA